MADTDILDSKISVWIFIVGITLDFVGFNDIICDCQILILGFDIVDSGG